MVFGVVLLSQLALAVPLVVGAAGQAVLGGFQAVFGVPAVASGGTLLALPSAFYQAAVAVFALAGLGQYSATRVLLAYQISFLPRRAQPRHLEQHISL